MTRDSTATHLHMHHSHHADLLEQFTNLTSSQLTPEDIYIPAYLQPVNPEDEEDVVPDQHAAFGIQRATQTRKEPTWRDLGLEELLRRGPGGSLQLDQSGSGTGSGSVGVRTGGLALARPSEPVRLALNRQPGAQTVRRRSVQRAGQVQTTSSRTSNSLPR